MVIHEHYETLSWIRSELRFLARVKKTALPLVSHPGYHRPGTDLRDIREDLMAKGLTQFQCRQVIGRSRTRVIFDASRPSTEIVRMSLQEYRQLRATL